MEVENTAFLNVIGNSLIGEKIVSYLSINDCKRVSSSSRALHGMVRDSQSFWERVALALTSNKQLEVVNNPLSSFHLSTGCWTAIEFDISISQEVQGFLDNNPGILENITSLQLSWSFTDNDNRYSDNHMEPDGWEILFQKIVDSCRKILDFQIDLDFLTKLDLSGVFCPDFVNGIRSLEIFRGPETNDVSHSSRLKGKDPTEQNLQHFFAIGLKTVKITLLPLLNTTSIYIFRMLVSNAESLEAMFFHNFGLCAIELMRLLVEFPNLRVASFFKVAKNSDLLSEFLQVQPPLEELVVHFTNQCPTTFLEYLESKGKSLRVLNLSMEKLESGRDWSWLENCMNLKEFSIIQEAIVPSLHREMKATGPSFLRWLPPSLTKLSLKGMKHFWKEQSDLNEPNISEVAMVSLLSRFPSVTHLDLSGSRDGVITEAGLHTILQHMDKLQVLKFSAETCLDFSPPRTKAELGEYVSVTEVGGGLIALRIRNINGEFPSAWMSPVGSPDLQSAEIESCIRMLPDKIKEQIKVNPGLARVLTRLQEMEGLAFTISLYFNKVKV